MRPELEAFERLIDIISELREKCPWDQKQTIESLRYLTIEETYELSDAIIDNDMEEVKKELGDIIMHVVFYAQIGFERKEFAIDDVINSVCEKLIRRHPHIYGDVVVQDEEEVKRNWEQIKLDEGKKSVLEGVPKSLPAMVKANRIQEKARGIGFDWDKQEQVWDKVKEELSELQTEVENGADHARIEDEFGDVLFSMINYSRFIGVNPEDALERTNKKFIHRFQYLEEKVAEQGKKMADMTLGEMEAIWQEAKTMPKKD
ncbi:nucleoside triphosphate pyrophosphohydrolase [Salibacteraceae bacterium]|nr:nucleoside triphosphate pyrophosphohydrolase [Salibacteraceae bacterium]MDC1220304.1 nucleoside triphosphate pyrophosphohydrolase [bacterium]MDB0002670.1 nucleoside triphosphate pyrophosphohydrolase [Salibacteraceae bacterium]MDB4104128.1 nucleoside triphosphate pyrophosphohydrolase [Salibacteraceae bacterium]MDB9708495.1 nucleoside triphosphate pyrophosphohydrolase [Salibacteraceae bacterium]